MVTFTEKKRTYHPDQQMPVTLLARARNLKRKVEKIFKNRQGLSLRGQNKGKIDAAKVYKLAMNRMDFFKRTQRSEPFEGCVYLLLDNSGSMGNGRMSKRNYCCGAAAVIEYAFSEHVLLKETAFTAYTDYMVDTRLSKTGMSMFLRMRHGIFMKKIPVHPVIKMVILSAWLQKNYWQG